VEVTGNRLIGTRHVERYARRCEITGATVSLFRQIAHEAGWSHPRSPAESFHSALTSLHARSVVKTGPHVAAELARDRVPDSLPGFPFNPGDIHLAAAGPRLLEISSSEIDDVIRRHTNGDAGMHGGQWASLEPTDEENWCPPLAPIPVRNRIALSAASGLIVSRFPMPLRPCDTPGHHDADPIVHKRRRHATEWIEVITLYVPGSQPRTLVRTSVDPAQL
jgi:hypothetical protein